MLEVTLYGRIGWGYTMMGRGRTQASFCNAQGAMGYGMERGEGGLGGKGNIGTPPWVGVLVGRELNYVCDLVGRVARPPATVGAGSAGAVLCLCCAVLRCSVLCLRYGVGGTASAARRAARCLVVCCFSLGVLSGGGFVLCRFLCLLWCRCLSTAVSRSQLSPAAPFYYRDCRLHQYHHP